MVDDDKYKYFMDKLQDSYELNEIEREDLCTKRMGPGIRSSQVAAIIHLLIKEGVLK